VAQQYLDHAPIATSTRGGYRDSLNIYWIPRVGHLPIAGIRLATLRRIDESIAWTSAKTRTNAITALRQVFAYALELELVDSNPAARLKIRKDQTSEPDPYTIEERAKLLAHLEAKAPAYAYRYFRIAFDTGMRTGELIALRWPDWNGESFHVKRTRVRREDKKSTKTNRARRVMIGDPTTRALLDAAAVRFDAPVIVNQYGRHYQSAYHLNQFFREAHAATGVRLRSGPYPWRHTYASLGIAAGLPPAFLAKQLGHSLDVFFRKYATWITGDNDRALAEKLADAMRA
jgi:integrase